MKSEIRCTNPRCVSDIEKYGEHYHGVHTVQTAPSFMPNATAMCERCGGYSDGILWKHVCKSCGKEVAPGELTGLFVPHLCGECEVKATERDVARGAVCGRCRQPFVRCCC